MHALQFWNIIASDSGFASILWEADKDLCENMEQTDRTMHVFVHNLHNQKLFISLIVLCTRMFYLYMKGENNSTPKQCETLT